MSKEACMHLPLGDDFDESFKYTAEFERQKNLIKKLSHDENLAKCLKVQYISTSTRYILGRKVLK